MRGMTHKMAGAERHRLPQRRREGGRYHRLTPTVMARNVRRVLSPIESSYRLRFTIVRDAP